MKWLTLLVALALSACAGGPDTGLRPDPPPSFAALKHPFKGAKLYADPDSAGAKWQKAHGDPDWLDPITQTPQAIWLTSPQDLDRLPALTRAADAKQALLVLVAYYIPDRGCTGHKDGAPTPETYLDWIERLRGGLGTTKAAIILEPDAIAADCFSPRRAELLREAVGRLAAAGHYTYLDAGHPRWKPTGEAAQRLMAAGIQGAQGFSVNVSNRQATEESDRWGFELSDLVGDREFVIDTSRNGAGPPPDNEWCNPSHQALGAKPSTDTGMHAAALLWVKRPGESDGLCGGETTYEFASRQAANLVANAQWVSERLRAEANVSK